MPILGEIITKTITLPVSGAVVSIKNDLTVSKGIAIFENADEDSNTNIVTGAIVSWDFTNDDGTPTPINSENVRKLFAVDFMTIIQELKLDRLQTLTTEKKSN